MCWNPSVNVNSQNYSDYSTEKKNGISIQTEATFLNKIWKGMKVSLRILYQTPAEAAAIAVGAIVMRVLFPAMATPFIGICASLVITRFAIKIIDLCAIKSVSKLKKEACKLNKRYPKLHLISFLFALAISVISPFVGLIFGTAIGSYSAIILDVENNKFARQNRKDK